MSTRRYRNRSQSSTRKPAPGTGARVITKEQTFDKWLRRVSYLSQAGLLLFAAGSMYFVIMPLYMNAALDEAIARKANDIRRVSVSVDAAYVRRRSVIMRDFIRSAAGECSASALATASIQVSPPGDKTAPASQISIAACLQKLVAAWSDIKELRPGDQDQLIKEIKLTGLALEEERHMARVKYDAVARIALVSPDALPRPSPLNQQSIDFNTKFSTPDQIAKQVLKARIEAEQQRIEAAYTGQITQHLAALEGMMWSPNYGQ